MKRFILLGATLGLILAAPVALADGSCDFDGSGSCDESDREILMSLQGATRGQDASYREDVDLDGDGVISLADAGIFLQLAAGN